MSKLLMKEFRLSMHPTAPLMVLLSAMVFIPNYPFVVIFFYVSMSVFFTCLDGRENKDIAYSLSLPIAKRDIVRARISFSALVEAVQLIIMLPLIFLAQRVNPNGNQAGLDANIALIGLGFISYGIFNFIFFTSYYKNVNKVGSSFIKGSIALTLCMAADIVSTYAVPFVRDILDTPDSSHIVAKLIYAGTGAIVFLVLTLAACRIGEKRFDALDLN